MSAVREAVQAAIEPKYRELLIGGTRTVKMIGREKERKFQNLDHVQWDGTGPLDFPDATFDEIHSYHQLQRLGRQGDFVTFFAQMTELWRLLKDDGLLCLTVPSPMSPYLWGDPGNTRSITDQTITYLTQTEYDRQVGVTSMVDYRAIYRADFEPKFLQDDHRELRVILRAVKPSRCSL